MTTMGSFRDQDTFVEIYDSYDKSFLQWLLNTVKRQGKSVPAIFATPERAFGQLSKLLRKAGSTYTSRTIPLPFLSVQQLSDAYDHDRRWHAGNIRKMQMVDQYGNNSAEPGETPDDADQIDSWLGMPFPQPVVLNYQVEAWARVLRDLQLIKKRIMMQLNHGSVAYLSVQHAQPFGWVQRPVTLKNVADNSMLEVAEGQEKILRHTYDFLVEAWMCFPVTTTKAVKAAVVDIHEEDSDEFMDRVWLYDERSAELAGDTAFDRGDFYDNDHRYDP